MCERQKMKALSQLHGLLSGSKPVTVRRDHVVQDMMELYKDTDILQHMLNVSFEGEEGQDAGGLTKDVFTVFWEGAYTKFFSGEEHERKLTRKGLDCFETLTQGETSQLIDMFARFNMAVVPTRNTFQQHVLNLAVCELTGRPSFLCNQMKSGIPDLYQDVFFHRIAKEGLVSLCERLQPTPSRVADLLRTDHELRPEEDSIFYFLKDFVHSLSSQEDLIRFLQFVTASSVMPSLGITVTFHHADGVQRHPIGRTCGNVLDLPLEYDTLQEFKREFLSVIRNDDSFRMFMM